MPTGGLDFAALGAVVEGGLDAGAAGIASGLGSLGIGAETAGLVGTGLVDAGVGAGLGATESAVTGGNPLTGAEFGGITGGVLGGAGPAIGSALGSTTAGDALAGAAGGALGGAATGGNIGQDALIGGVGGGVTGALSGSSTGTSGGPPTGGAAGAPAAPAGVVGNVGGDVTLDNSSQFPTGVNGASGGSPSPDVGALPSAGITPVTQGDITPLSNGAPPIGGAPVGSTGAGIDQALSSDISGGPGSSFGSNGGGSSFGSGSTDSFLKGSPGGGANIGQGPTATSAPSAGATPNSFQAAISDPSLSNIGKALGNNAGLLTSVAGLGKDFIDSGPLPGEKALKGEAQNLQGQGQQLQNYLNTGTLPPGIQGGINQALASAQAAIKSKYAQMGMSGSSAEQQDLANAQASAATQGANIAMSLLSKGVEETGLSDQIYQELIKNSMANDQSFSSALTNLGSAVGGGTGGGTTIKIGG